MRNLLYGFVLFLAGQTLIWFQTNLQFINTWAKDHTLIMAAIFSTPISYMFIKATAFLAEYYDGEIWPGRMIGFGSGMIVFAFLAYLILGEGISAKTAVSLVLATTLVLIQVLWK